MPPGLTGGLRGLQTGGPIGEYQKYSRNVYLPKQKGWYDFYTGKHYAGGQTIVADAPFDSKWKGTRLDTK